MTARRELLAIGSLALALAAAELGARALGPQPSAPLVVSDPLLHHAHRPSSLWHAADGHDLQFDDEGRVFDPELRVERPRSGIRIALMGASFVEAAQVPYRESFGGRLEAANRPAAAIRNYGVVAYSPVLYLLQWRNRVRAYKPTEVVLVLCANDVEEDDQYDHVATHAADGQILAVPAPGLVGVRGLAGRSALLRLVAFGGESAWFAWRHRNDEVFDGDDEASPPVAGITDRTLRTLAAEISEAGAALLLTAVPSRARVDGRLDKVAAVDFAERCRLWAASAGVRFVDLTPAFLHAPPAPPLFLKQDIHWSPAGHAIVAATLQRALRQR